MPSPSHCQQCGTSLDRTSLGGLCPRCLLLEGLPGAEGIEEAGRTAPPLNPVVLQYFGDYELIGEIARGGMGIVFRARQRSLDRTVAVKVLSAGEFALPENVRRFRVEAAAAARLQHPNIVAIHEIGEHSGVQFFSMEFIEGRNLAGHMDGRPMAARDAAACLRRVAEAVHHAHQRGILHRDLKPSNILIDPFGEPRITDFGLARELDRPSDLTLTGQILGTPGFLPPEQADPTRGPIGPAADIHSLGAVLYYMLTARAPFVAGSPQATLKQLLHDDPIAPRLLHPDLPRDLETICLKCLEREPERRYPSAAALADDLGRYLRDEPITARPVSPANRFLRWCRRRPALATVWVLIAALAVGSTAASAWIAAARQRAEVALDRARSAEAAGRERLREARLAEARAIRRTSLPGRRAQALAALSEASGIRPGRDLRDEALAALLIPDVHAEDRWDLHLGAPSSIHFDPAGQQAAVEFRDSLGVGRGEVQLRSWGRPEELTRFTVPEARPVGEIRFSADGSRLVTRYSDDTVRVFANTHSNALLILRERPAPRGEMRDFSLNLDFDFSPDARQLAAGLAAGGFSLHHLPDGGEIARTPPGAIFNIVRYSPDGRRIAAVTLSGRTPPELELRLADNLEVERRVSLPNPATWLNWSADSRVLAVALPDQTVLLHDASDGRLLTHLPAALRGHGELRFLDHDTLIARRGIASTLRLTGILGGNEEIVVTDYGPNALAADATGSRFVTCSLDGVATRWAVDSPVGFRAFAPPRAGGYERSGDRCGLDLSPDGRWVATGHSRYSVVRDLASGRLATEIDTGPDPGYEPGSVAFGPGGRSLLRAAAATGLARHQLTPGPPGTLVPGPAELLDPEPGFYLGDRTEDRRRVILISVGRAERDVRPANLKVVEIGETGARTLARWHVPGLYSACFSPDGERILTNPDGLPPGNEDHRIRVYRAVDGQLLNELDATVACDTAWSADGRTAMTSNGRTNSIVWDTATWTPRLTLGREFGGDVTTFTLSPDGAWAVIYRNARLHLVSTASGESFAALEPPGDSGLPVTIRFLPDGHRFLVLGRDGRLDLYDPQAWRGELARLKLDW